MWLIVDSQLCVKWEANEELMAIGHDKNWLNTARLHLFVWHWKRERILKDKMRALLQNIVSILAHILAPTDKVHIINNYGIKNCQNSLLENSTTGERNLG